MYWGWGQGACTFVKNDLNESSDQEVLESGAHGEGVGTRVFPS